MRVFRGYYQLPVVELVVLPLAVVAHASSGVALMWRRWQRQAALKDKAATAAATAAHAASQTEKDLFAGGGGGDDAARDPSLLWMRRAGYVLLALIVPHALATRVIPVLVLDPPSVVDETYASATTMVLYPGAFHLYYAILGVAGAYHAAHGAASANRRLGLLDQSDRTTRISAAVASVAMVSAVLAMSGIYFPVNLSRLPLFYPALKAANPFLPPLEHYVH
jgi:hypothetical protein